jgi:hypothetical protein
VELYTLGYISDNIILECFEFLVKDRSEQNVEISCSLMEKMGNYIFRPKPAYLQAKGLKVKDTGSRRNSVNERRGSVNEPPAEGTEKYIDYEVLNEILHDLFKLRNDKQFSSRIRFKIQDLMDLYEKDWKPVIEGGTKVVKVWIMGLI